MSRYMPLRRKPPSQSWRTFLRNHGRTSSPSTSLFVPTATFRVLYVFLVLDKDAPEPRRREPIEGGKVLALPMVGGLHHRYTRRSA